MANKFLARYKDDEEESYAPRQRGLGRRVFEGIAKKRKYDKNLEKSKRARDLEISRPPTYEDAEKYMEETNRKLKKRAK